MQTCVGSVAGTAFTGGFGSYLIAMDQQSYENVGNVAGNNSWVRLSRNAGTLKTAMPSLVWTMSINTCTAVAALGVAGFSPWQA